MLYDDFRERLTNAPFGREDVPEGVDALLDKLREEALALRRGKADSLMELAKLSECLKALLDVAVQRERDGTWRTGAPCKWGCSAGEPCNPYCG